MPGESASLFIRDGDARICLVRVEAEQSVRDSARRLLPLALDDTSSGLVLRGLGGDGVGAVEGPFRPIFTSGVTDPQTASLSAPVFDAEGDIVAAMTVSGPAFRLTGEVAERFASRLAAQAEAFSASLGYRAEMPPSAARAARSRRTPRARGSGRAERQRGIARPARGMLSGRPQPRSAAAASAATPRNTSPWFPERGGCAPARARHAAPGHARGADAVPEPAGIPIASMPRSAKLRQRQLLGEAVDSARPNAGGSNARSNVPRARRRTASTPAPAPRGCGARGCP